MNAYVRVHTGFRPIDYDDALLAVEPEVPSPELQGFPWEELKQGTAFLHSTYVTASCAVDHCHDVRLVQELSTSLYTYITRDKYPMWCKDRQDLVEYGVARFMGEVIVEEPMALVGILRIVRQKDSQSMVIFERACGSSEWALACLTSFRSKEVCQIGRTRGPTS